MPRSFMPEVTLPAGFQVDKEVKEGVVHFHFSSPVELPLDEATFEECVRRERKLQKKGGSREENRAQYDTVPILHAHAERVLGTALPQFVNPDFYVLEKHLHESDVHFMSRLRAIPRGLHVWIEEFNPYTALREGKRPVIVEGNIKGAVHLPARIWKRDGPTGPRAAYSGMYDGQVSSSILTALLYEEPLAMKSQSFSESYIREHLVVPIANPTIERMEAVRREGEQINDYFNTHLDQLSTVGEIYERAKSMHWDNWVGVQGSYGILEAKVQETRRILKDRNIPLPTIDDTLARIQTHVDRKLSEAADILAPLAEHFPRGLLPYIASEPSP